MRRFTLLVIIAFACSALFAVSSAQAPPAGLVIDPDRQSLPEMKNLIARGADVNFKDEDGATPLMKAVYFGDLQVARLLIENGADAKAADKNGVTVLMNAAASGSLDTVKLIVKHGADVNARDCGGATPLMYAALSSKDEYETAKFLIAKGADPSVRDLRGCTAYSIAVNRGKNELAKYLESYASNSLPVPMPLFYALCALVGLLAIKSVLNAIARRRNSATAAKNNQSISDAPSGKPSGQPKAEKPPIDLLEAVSNEDIETLKRGIAEGGDPNFVDKNGWSLLMHATGRGFDSIVALLLEHKANVNFQDESGKTPLINAVSLGRITTARLLVGGGADVNLRDHAGRSAYSIAVEKGDKKLMNLLKAAGADEAQNDAAPTAPGQAVAEQTRTAPEPAITEDFGKDLGEALRTAVSQGNARETADLIAAGAPVDAPDPNGTTPLMIAAGAGRLDLIKLLIQAKADLNAANSKGVTPLIFAAAKGRLKAVILLVKAGADYNARTKNGVTALKYCIEKGFDDIAAVLRKVGASE